MLKKTVECWGEKRSCKSLDVNRFIRPSGTIKTVNDLSLFPKSIPWSDQFYCNCIETTVETSHCWQRRQRYLLTDEAKTSILSDALIGFPQHRIKGLIAVSERRSGITRNSKGSNVDLDKQKQKK